MTNDVVHDDETVVTTTTDPWDVVADTEAEAHNLRLRADLMLAIDNIVRTHGWSQAHAARYLGITQPRMSDLLRGKIDKFSLDSLVNIGMELGLQLTIIHNPMPQVKC